MKPILDFIVDILSQPAILVALIALIGLIMQKKSATDITSGTIKTILGFLVLSAGANVVTQSLEPFGKYSNTLLACKVLYLIMKQLFQLL